MASFVNKILNRGKYKPNQPLAPKSIFSYSGGTYVNEDSAMKVAAFYRGVTYISTQIAKLPWHVKSSKNEILNDELSRFLRLKPNKEMNAFSFRLFLIQQAIIYGNGYAEIERDRAGRIKGLWPIRATDVNLWRTQDGELVYRIVGGSSSNPGEDAYLAPSDIYHIKNFFTKDGLLGQGVVAYGSDTLGISLGANRFANNLFSNGAMPSGILKTEGTISDEAFDRIKETWEKNHGGRKTGGTAILEEGLSYQQVSLSPDVMQFLESRKFSVLEIARFLGLPPTKLFDGESATYNNIEHANLEVAVDTLDAWARNLEIEADVKLLSNSRQGKKTEMDLYSVFRGDMKTRGEYFTKRMQTGSITPNQIRELEGDAPYKDGDRYYIATNNYTPVDRMDEIFDSQVNKNKNSNQDKNSETELNEAVASYLKKK